MSFPTLTAAPNSIKRDIVDNTLRSPTEAGYVQARPRTTREIYTFDVGYILNAADLALLQTHDDTVTGSSIFAWTNTDESVTYNVRYSKRFTKSRTPDSKGRWPISFSLQTV
jgi:hypothetical protein